MSLLDRITIDSEVVHGRPAIRGTRMRVADVLSLLASGASHEEILEDYPYLAADDDIGFGDVSDRVLWRYALEHEAVIVTKDEDFSRMVATETVTPTVVWIRVGNTRRAALFAWFEPLIPRIVAMVESGDRLIELR